MDTTQLLSDGVHWRGRPLAERQNYVEHRLFIGHPQLARVLNVIRERIEYRKSALRGYGLLIVAPPDGGKSRLGSYLAERMPRVEETERTHVPLVYVEVPDPCTPLEFANATLRSLGDPFWQGSKLVLQKQRVMTLIRNVGTLVLVIDNTQDIPERRGVKGIQRVGNFIRDLIQEARLVVVLLGTEEAEVVVHSNPQLKKRVPGKLELCSYDISSPDGLGKFLRFIDQCEQRLPLGEYAEIAKTRAGKSLVYAADGKIGAAISLFSRAIKFALASGRERLTEEDLYGAYLEHFLDYSGSINPFDPGFQWRRLNQPGEPYFNASEYSKSIRNTDVSSR